MLHDKLPVLDLNREFPLPLYFQVKQSILRQLESGDLAPGDVLPTEKELEGRYGVSRITVRRALTELASEGYLSRQPGRGTFVCKPKLQPTSDGLGTFFQDLAAQGWKITSEILELGRTPASKGVAQKLGVAEGTWLIAFRRLVYADDEPIAISSVWLNLGEQVVLTREELKTGSMYPLLEAKYGISIHRAHKTIEATAALKEEAEALHTVPNAPLLLAEWLVVDKKDNPVIFMKALYRGDRYKHYLVVTR